jgi:hypothetical protein
MDTIGQYPVKKYLGSLVAEGLYNIYPMDNGADLHPDHYGKTKGREVTPFTRKVGAIGVINVVSLEELITISEGKIDVSPEAKIWLKKGYDFYRVTLAADFSVDSSLRFKDAIIAVTITTPFEPHQVKIWSYYPQSQLLPKRITKKVALDAAIKFFEVEVNVGNVYSYEQVYYEMHPWIVSHCVGDPTFHWEYRTNDIIKEIVGTQLVDFVVKQPVGVKTEWAAKPDGNLQHYPGTYFSKVLYAFKDKPAQPNISPGKFTVPLI